MGSRSGMNRLFRSHLQPGSNQVEGDFRHPADGSAPGFGLIRPGQQQAPDAGKFLHHGLSTEARRVARAPSA